MRQSTIPRRSIRFDRGACGPWWPRVVSADCQLTSQVACQLNFPILSVFGLLFLSFFSVEKKGKIYNDRLLFSPGHPPSSRVLFWGTLSMSMSIVFVRLCLKRPRNSGQKKGQVCPKLTWSDSFDRATSLGCPCVKLFAFFSSPSWSNKAECYESLCRQMIHSNFDKWMNRDFNKTAIRSIPQWNFQVQVITLVWNNLNSMFKKLPIGEK